MRPQDKLRSLLLEQGFDVDFFMLTKGYWSHAHQDCCRWEAYAFKDGERRHLMSWSTMTECARKGITIELESGTYMGNGYMSVRTTFEVEAKVLTSAKG